MIEREKFPEPPPARERGETKNARREAEPQGVGGETRKTSRAGEIGKRCRDCREGAGSTGLALLLNGVACSRGGRDPDSTARREAGGPGHGRKPEWTGDRGRRPAGERADQARWRSGL